MSRDGSGNYSLAAGNPVVTGTSISSTWANNTLNDVASALTQSVSKDGQTAMTGTLNMSGNAINNATTVAANSFIPNGATIPTNGLYLSAANTLALSSNTTLRWSVNSTGNHVIAAPSSGAALTASAAAGVNASIATWNVASATSEMLHTFQLNSVSKAYMGLIGTAGNLITGTAQNDFALRLETANLLISTNAGSTAAVKIASAGNVTVAAPTSGVALAVTGFAGSAVLSLTGSGTGAVQSYTDGTRTATLATVAGGYELKATSAHSLALGANNTVFLSIASAGNITTAAPTSGVGLTVAGFAGTHSTKIQDSAGTALNVGYLEIPQNIQNVAYAPVLSDAGKHIYHSDGTARTYTIPANASVAYPIGTTLTFVNDASAGVNVTIAITTDTLYWAADGTTGSRTLARYGIATALKVTATRWSLSGTGIS